MADARHRDIPLRVSMALVVFVLALLVRLPDLDRFATIDESRWIQRGADFWTFMRKGDHAETFLIGHPGVTTMWLVGLGMGPERVERMATRPGAPDVTRREGYLDALVAARRAFVVLGAALIVGMALLVTRLAGPGPGLLSGVLLAADPFYAAHGQVAHLDATLAGWMTLAVLSAFVVALRGGGLGYVALSGVATGLALLTKAPSIYLLPIVPSLLALPTMAILLAHRLAGKSELAKRGIGQDTNIRGTALRVALWGALALIVVAALWPAFRVDPLGTLSRLAQFTSRVGGGEHDNFFMGQPTDDPGALYYPTMLMFRMGLGTMIGIILLAALGRRDSWRGLLLGSAAVMLGFMLMMNLGPKKFDRYLLPILPLVMVWAALGWWGWLAGLSRSLMLTGVALAVAAQIIPAISARPYYLAYYNPLLGGGPAAQRQVLVGWGEALEPVAAYLNAQPIVIGAPTVASSYHRVLQAHLSGSALPIDRVSFADYVVPYVNTLQRGMEQDVLGPIVNGQMPELTVWHNGIEYARVYRGPHYPVTLAINAPLGEVTLVEAVIAPGALTVRPQEAMDVLLRWRGQPAGEALVEVRLEDGAGRPFVTGRKRIGEDGVGGHRGGAEDQLADLHTLTVPRNAAPGRYRLLATVGAASALLADVSIEAGAR